MIIIMIKIIIKIIKLTILYNYNCHHHYLYYYFYRRFLEAADTFVGRYLVVATSIYIVFKLAHYKLFNGP